jgi:murein peptide amidase A
MANCQFRVGAMMFLAAGLAIASTPRPTFGDDSTDKPPLVEKYVAGRSVGGRPIDCEVYGNGPDVLLVIATIHGSEPAGTPLVAAFAKWLVAHPAELAGRTVVIVPVANPDGFAANERFNAHGVDLNRNFPASNWGVPQEQDSPDSMKAQTSPGGDTFAQGKTFKPGDTPLSEPESRALMQLICRYYPNRIISIHQPIGCIDYDGPAEKLAAAMGAKCPLPVKQVGSRPGSLGSFVGNTLQRPIITWELPEDAGMDGEVLWKTYGKALVAALRFEGMTREN